MGDVGVAVAHSLLNDCTWSSPMSKRCCRDYLALYAPTLAETHPHVELQTIVKRNRFPLVKAEYGAP